MAARIQLVLQIDQGNLDGMRGLASTDAVYIASAGGIEEGRLPEKTKEAAAEGYLQQLSFCGIVTVHGGFFFVVFVKKIAYTRIGRRCRHMEVLEKNIDTMEHRCALPDGERQWI